MAISHGTYGDGGVEINLFPDEFITAIEGSTAGEWITGISFVTTKSMLTLPDLSFIFPLETRPLSYGSLSS